MIYKAASETAKSQGEQRKILLLFRSVWETPSNTDVYTFSPFQTAKCISEVEQMDAKVKSGKKKGLTSIFRNWH